MPRIEVRIGGRYGGESDRQESSWIQLWLWLIDQLSSVDYVPGDTIEIEVTEEEETE